VILVANNEHYLSNPQEEKLLLP